MNSVLASEDMNGNLTKTVALPEDNITDVDEHNTPDDISMDLKTRIENSENGDEIMMEPGTYKANGILITKNITLQGNGNPRDVVIDGEEKSSIFMIRSPNVYVTFKNITFINGLTHNFGGAISIETGNVYVDDCIFANNTALSDTNAGAISNYGTKKDRGYLFVNNSMFINNHADHDGGAITTCYANSDIYNSVFINNSACRDGGAIRVSVFGYGNVQDCIFMFNHADEWGGAYYSWSGESNIERCIFMNNSGGTNGGAVMVSGNINIEDSIITNNNGGETGGSFYIQQPMYDTKTVINVHNNLITNNTSPYGKEIFIKWWDSYNLYTQFDDNDWGDEDPNDSSVIDPDNVTPRSKVSSTVKSNLFAKLNLDLLNKYDDLIGHYFKDDSLDGLKKQFDDAKAADQNADDNPNQNSGDGKTSNGQTSNVGEKRNTGNSNEQNQVAKPPLSNANDENSNSAGNESSKLINLDSSSNPKSNSDNQMVSGNSTTHGDDRKSYELNETGSQSVSKQGSVNLGYFIALILIIVALLAIGYVQETKNNSK